MANRIETRQEREKKQRIELEKIGTARLREERQREQEVLDVLKHIDRLREGEGISSHDPDEYDSDEIVGEIPAGTPAPVNLTRPRIELSGHLDQTGQRLDAVINNVARSDITSVPMESTNTSK